MTYHERAQRAAEPEEDESVFVLGMVGVGDQKCVFVEEHRLRLLERNTVLMPVSRVLSVIPLEAERGHSKPV